MKPREAFMPTLMPLTTPSTGVPGMRWAMAMLTQSLGVPSTIHVGQPKPRLTAAERTGLARVLEAPVQLCSVTGATTFTSWPVFTRAATSSWRKTLSMPSSLVTRSFMEGGKL